MEIRLISADQNGSSLWDEFVARSPIGTIFHKRLWLDVCNGNVDIWGAFEGDTLAAGFVAPYHTIFAGKTIRPPLFTPYCGLVFPAFDGKYVNEISRKKKYATEFSRIIKEKYRWGILRFHPAIMDMQPFIWNGFSVGVKYTYVVDISSMESVWRNLGSPTTRSIRKAEKDGLHIVSPAKFEDTLDILKKTYARQKLTFPVERAKRLEQELDRQHLCRSFVCLDSHGNKIATQFIIWDEKSSYAVLGGYDAEKKHAGAHSLCLWAAMKFAFEELNLSRFDYEGSMIPRVERFYRNFGGRITPFYEIRWGPSLEALLRFRELLRKISKK